MIHGGEAPGGGAVLCFLGRGGCGGGGGGVPEVLPPLGPFAWPRSRVGLSRPLSHLVPGV